MSREAELLRHFIATIVCRLEKAIRNAPPESPTLRAASTGMPLPNEP